LPDEVLELPSALVAKGVDAIADLDLVLRRLRRAGRPRRLRDGKGDGGEEKQRGATHGRSPTKTGWRTPLLL
jgi:hypothetical protein